MAKYFVMSMINDGEDMPYPVYLSKNEDDLHDKYAAINADPDAGYCIDDTGNIIFYIDEVEGAE